MAQPHVVAGDIVANLDAHAALIDRSHVRLVVFPKLSLTGYELDTPPINIASDLMGPLVSICAATDSVALVGAPVVSDGQHYIATVLVDSTGSTVVYRKTISATASKHGSGQDQGRKRSLLMGGASAWGYAAILGSPNTSAAQHNSA